MINTSSDARYRIFPYTYTRFPDTDIYKNYTFTDSRLDNQYQYYRIVHL